MDSQQIKRFARALNDANWIAYGLMLPLIEVLRFCSTGLLKMWVTQIKNGRPVTGADLGFVAFFVGALFGIFALFIFRKKVHRFFTGNSHALWFYIAFHGAMLCGAWAIKFISIPIGLLAADFRDALCLAYPIFLMVHLEKYVDYKQPAHSDELAVPAPRGEFLPNASARTILANFLGACFVVFMLNLAFMFLVKAYPTNLGYWLVESKWNLLKNLDAPTDWLILGDSSCNQGVDPQTLTDELGGTAVNLCTIASLLLTNDAWMLEKYIERFPPPENILIVHVYDIYQRKADPVVVGKIPLPYGFWNKLTPSISLSAGDKWNVLLTRYLPLYSQNRTLKQIVLYPWILKTPKFTSRKDGFMISREASPVQVEEDFERHASSLRKKTFEISPANQKALNQILAFAQQHNINIFFANSALYEKLAVDKYFKIYFADEKKELTALFADTPQVRYITDSPMPVGAMQAENIDHITYPAAKLYTKHLTDQIRQKTNSK